MQAITLFDISQKKTLELKALHFYFSFFFQFWAELLSFGIIQTSVWSSKQYPPPE